MFAPVLESAISTATGVLYMGTADGKITGVGVGVGVNPVPVTPKVTGGMPNVPEWTVTVSV